MVRKRTYLPLALLLLWTVPSPAADPDPSLLQGNDAPAGSIWLDSLDLQTIYQDHGKLQRGRSVDGNAIRIHGTNYQHGLGTHAQSEIRIDLKGAATRFISMVGVDDETKGRGSLGFMVLVDGKWAAESRHWVKGGEEPQMISVNLTGAKELTLMVNDGYNGTNYDHADWAGSILMLDPNAKEKPVGLAMAPSPFPTIARNSSLKPAINNPRVTGSTPGRPFLFLIPATGEKPLRFSAKNLPYGLSLDENTGIITGSLKAVGTTAVELTVKNSRGTARGTLTIVGGKHKLAQTPPMGWNNYNSYCDQIDDQKVRETADAMVRSGLAAHGYQYINLDDCWAGKRDANGEIHSNEKFPDMKALTDYVHSKGLKIGIYSSPGPKTCGNTEASYQHEQQDALTYAKWGFDYLKYDWCSYGEIAPKNPDREARMKPHLIMRQALDNCDRDIVYSLCQYGDGNVWEWGAQVGGNCWRTTFDILDHWDSMAVVGFAQDGHQKYAGPGHWNDQDMLVLGRVGWGGPLRPTRLTPNEQITHMTLWCLQSSVLLMGGDLVNIDDFTLALLSNDEVLDVNQDPLGKPAGRITQNGQTEVWARPLSDGTAAAGLFNRDMQWAKVKVTWSDLKLSGVQPVRDLWQQKNLGNFADGFEVSVPPHGAVMLKIGKPRQ